MATLFENVSLIIVLSQTNWGFYRYAESVGAAHMYTSAKANRGLDEVFGSLAQSES
jgi:hypothetical protein